MCQEEVDISVVLRLPSNGAGQIDCGQECIAEVGHQRLVRL